VLRCHSRAAGPYRPLEPYPDYDCLSGYGEVELVGPPQPNDGPERMVAVQVLAPDAAVSLAAKGRAWEADLYRLAANRRAADLKPSLTAQARRDDCSWVRVVLVMAAGAPRRLGPSSSATTPTTERAPPFSALQFRAGVDRAEVGPARISTASASSRPSHWACA
jgi:hypothetical protein